MSVSTRGEVANLIKKWILEEIVNVEDLAHYLYENQPDCFYAISQERQLEASFDIAKAIVDKFNEKLGLK